MGMFFREVTQSQVDMEDLLNMLQTKSKIQESPDAKEFKFQQGEIEFKGVGFGHKVE